MTLGEKWKAMLEADVEERVRAAVAEERERCARVAVARAEFHRDNCAAGCRCADGWHIAAAIREG